MSFVAVAIGGSAVLGYVASSNATDAAADTASQSNQTMRDSAQLQYDLGKETLDFNREYYRDVVRPAADFDLSTRREITPILTRDLREQSQFAADQRQFYRDTFQPVERQMVRDAEGYDSDVNVNRRMGIAAASVNQQFSNARDQQARALTRFGLNPNSSAFARTNANLTAQQALASAGMQTGAAFDTQDKAIALRAGAANFGRNMPNTAAAFGGLGNQTAGTTTGITGGGVQVAGAAGNFMNQGFQVGSNINATGANISNNVFRNNLGLAQMQAGGVSDLFQGIGSAIGMAGRARIPGMPTFGGSTRSPSASVFNDTNLYGADPAFIIPGSFADGGQIEDPNSSGMTPDGRNFGLVRGPGTAISDEVPAVNVDQGQPLRLGNKEYVVPGDVVEKLGTLYFDKLIQKHHVPAEVQRMGLARSA